jgi:AcrR family transcriptional regulator
MVNHMPPADRDMKIKILMSAKHLFARQGFDNTSVRQICEDAGANVSLVSYYFGGKDNLFYELFNTFFPGKAQLDEYSHLWSEPFAGLKTLIQEVIRYRMSEPEMILLLQQEIFKNSHRIEHIRKHSFPVWQVLRELLERGKEQGVFRYRSLDNTMFFIMGTILFHKHTEYFKPLLAEAPPSLEELVQDTLHFVMQGLGAVAEE